MGEDHRDYATSLNNLGTMYQDMGDYPRAEPLLCQSMEIRKKALGEDHADYAASLNNLGTLYQTMGDYARAEPMLRETVAIWKKAVGVEHTDYAKGLDNLAALYHAMGDYARAEPLIIEALKITSNFTRDTSAVLGDRQRLRIYQDQRGALDAYFSVSRSTDAKPADLYRHVLDWKAAAEARRGEDWLARDQPELAPSLAKLAQVRGELANLAFALRLQGRGRLGVSSSTTCAKSRKTSRRIWPAGAPNSADRSKRNGRDRPRWPRPCRPRWLLLTSSNTPTTAHSRGARGRFRQSGDCWRSSCAAAGR